MADLHRQLYSDGIDDTLNKWKGLLVYHVTRGSSNDRNTQNNTERSSNFNQAHCPINSRTSPWRRDVLEDNAFKV